jgi:hypothetical protein
MALTISNAAAKVVNLAGGIVAEGFDVAGGYFVIDALSNIPSYANQTGQLCFCTGDSKFYQYNGSSWEEVKLVTTKTSELTDDIGLAKNADLAELRSQVITDITNNGSEVSFTKNGQTSSFNTTFVGTREAYNAAYAAGHIPVGTIVIITDEDDEDDNGNTGDSGATSPILGQGVLGYLILG